MIEFGETCYGGIVNRIGWLIRRLWRLRGGEDLRIIFRF